MGLLIFYVLLALGVSFLCSVMEAVLLSVTPSYIASLQSKGKPSGARLRKLKDNVDRPLAAILSLNTIAHTIGAAGAGAQAAHVYGDAYVGLASAVLTLLILILSEIIPKTLGAAFWRSLAPFVAAILIPLIWALYPLVLMSQGLTLLLAHKGHGITVSREEVAAMAELGAAQGVLKQGESQMLANLLRLSSLRVEDIMTPRTVVHCLPQSSTVGEALPAQEKNPFSRIPVYEKNRDDITGYVLKSDILLQGARDKIHLPLVELRRPIKAVLETHSLAHLFDILLEEKTQIALVVGEYGGTEGIVTLEDLVETLLGMEIVDEGDTVTDMRELARSQWEKRAAHYGILLPSDGEDANAGTNTGINAGTNADARTDADADEDKSQAGDETEASVQPKIKA